MIVYGSCFLLLVWLFVLGRFFGSENLLYLYTPCLHLPELALFMYLSPERGWKTVFQFLSAVSLCFLVQQVGAVFMLVSGGKLWAMWMGYLLASAVELWLVLRYLRPISLRELPIMRHGWWLICSLLADLSSAGHFRPVQWTHHSDQGGDLCDDGGDLSRFSHPCFEPEPRGGGAP